MKDIIIFSGQSNMQGQSEKLLGDTPVPRAYEYLFLADLLVPLKNPCGENILADGREGYHYNRTSSTWHTDNMLGASCYQNTTLVPAFVKAYMEETDRECVAVHAARGATMISDWLSPSPRFNMFIRKCRAAIEKVKNDGELGRIWLVWLQGESDALEGVSREDYKRMLCDFKASVTGEIPLDGFGIIRVGKFANNEGDIEIIKAQEELCKSEGFALLTRLTGLCTSDPERYINPEAKGHYNAAALELIGSRAGENLGKLVMGKPFELEEEPYSELKN